MKIRQYKKLAAAALGLAMALNGLGTVGMQGLPAIAAQAAVETDISDNGSVQSDPQGADYMLLADVPADAPDAPDEEIVDNGTRVDNLFKDHEYKESVTDESIQIYANGGNVTALDGTKRNTKRAVIYTDILASYIYTTNTKGALVPSTGKVIVGVTTKNTKPELTKGKIVDTEGAKYAKATIKNGQITITAQKQAGTVYLWVMDTGMDQESVSCPIHVKMSPASIVAEKDAKKITATSVRVNEDIYVYLKPLQSDKTTVVDNCTFRSVVSETNKKYVKVTATENPYCFKITGVSKKDKGTTKPTVKFTCLQNGKKVSVAVTIKKAQ